MFQEQAKMVESWKKILWITLKKWNQHQLQVSTPSQCHQDWTMWIGSPAIQHFIYSLWIKSRILFRTPTSGKASIKNSNVWKSQNPEFQCLEIAKNCLEFQCLAKPKLRILMIGKAKIRNSFLCLEKPKLRISVFGKAKIQNSNDWKSQNSEFKCLEKLKFRIPMFGKAKIQNSITCKICKITYLYLLLGKCRFFLE